MEHIFCTDPNLIELFEALRLVVFDFDGVFTDNSVWTMENGIELVRCNRSDGLGIQKLKALGVETFVLSTEQNAVVSVRCQKLGINCFQNQKNKEAFLRQYLIKTDTPAARVAFLGNDINDMACLQMVGLPIVVCDAHRDVIPLARYVTQVSGGMGAVREVCDLIEFARTMKEP